MKSTLIRLLCFSVFLLMILNTQAQSKSGTGKKKSTSSTKEIPPPPPPKKGEEAPPEIEKLESVSDEDVIQKPVMNFDTSHVADDSFTADILKLMKITGTMNLGMMMAKGIEDKRTTEKSPMMKEFYTRFYDEMEHGAVNRHLVNYFVKVYRKHFTQQEINQLIAFYETDLGKKSISLLPQITQEAMEYGRLVGEYYGQKIMYEVMLEQEKKSN